jgi:hypothetical protein
MHILPESLLKDKREPLALFGCEALNPNACT